MQPDSTKERLDKLRFLANVMDSRFEVLGVRVGLDSIIGLVPGLGDLVTSLVAWYIVLEAYEMGVPDNIVFKMAVSVLADMFIGSIPIIGDVIDVAYRVNEKNVSLVEKHLTQNTSSNRV